MRLLNLKHKRRLFNVVFIFALVLVCATVSFLTVDFDGTFTGPSLDADADDFWQDEDEEGNNNSSIGNGNNMNSSTKLPELKNPITNPWIALQYAFSLEEKYSYKSSYSQIVNIELKALDISGKVMLSGTVYKEENEAYMNNRSDINFSIVSVPSESSSVYFDFDNEKVIHLGWTQTVQEFKDKYGYLPWKMPYLVNQESATATLKSDPNNSYNEIHVVLNSNGWKDYANGLVNVVEGIGGLQCPMMNISSISLVIKVNKKYGNIISIESTEKAAAKVSYQGIAVDLNCTGKYMLKYDFECDNTDEIIEISNSLGLKK